MATAQNRNNSDVYSHSHSERVKDNSLFHLFSAGSLGSRLEPESLGCPDAFHGNMEGSLELRSTGLLGVTMVRGKMPFSKVMG